MKKAVLIVILLAVGFWSYKLIQFNKPYKEDVMAEAFESEEATEPTAGAKLWEFETGGDVGSSPAIGSDGTMYIGSLGNKLYAIKTDSKGLAKSPWPMLGQNARHTGRALKK